MFFHSSKFRYGVVEHHQVEHRIGPKEGQVTVGNGDLLP
jgi:hypothetical protein